MVKTELRPKDLAGVCAIGASAGGLDPLEMFFGSIPTDTGLAFVVIQHLSPDHRGMMDSLLSRHTSMPVSVATDGDQLRPNRVYLIPPDRVLTVEGVTLRLTERDRSSSRSPSPHPIDRFFASLATEWGSNAAAIVLSGTGNDGALGTEQVREAGGLTLAQDATASFEGMPNAADARGFVDAVASVPAIADYVFEFFQTGKRPTSDSVDSHYSAIEQAIIGDLATSTGINFSDYKRGTVRRRIEHRMNAVGASTPAALAEIVKSSVDEQVALANDILIGVTAFFRDAQVFAELGRGTLQQLLTTAHLEGRSARAWVVGCATGQEAYSIAMALTEARAGLEFNVPIQVFATDVHETALSKATEGIYSLAELEGVSEERRLQFFKSHGDMWRVRDDLRTMVTFARHNMLTDTPFSRIDLVSCRNTLIYLTATAQQRALWALAFSLRPEGVLVLGTSETPGFLVPDFEPIAPAERIFRKVGDSAIKSFRRRMGPSLGNGTPGGLSIPRPPTGPDQALLRAYDQILDLQFVGGLIIDNRNEIIHVIGTAKSWLEHGTGRPNLDINSLVRDPNLRLAIGSILRELGEPDASESQRLSTINDMSFLLKGRRIRSAGTTYSMVSAHPVDVTIEVPSELARSIDPADLDRISQLESELAYTRESLQAALEEQETSNEELNGANEELIASNEELQSSNEELSALNEELRTLNDEHHRRLQEVLELTADLEQILTSTEIGILLLDSESKIRRFSDPARDFFHLVASDQGRPFEHIRARFDSSEFDAAVEKALESGQTHTLRASLGPGEDEILIRVRPYALPQDEVGASATIMRLGDAAQSKREGLLTGVMDSSPLRLYAFNEERVCELASGSDDAYRGQTIAEVAADQDATAGEIERLFDVVAESGRPTADVVRFGQGYRAVFVWRFDAAGRSYYGGLTASMQDLQATTASWVESQTLTVIADLLGVGAAVVAPDGIVGERFNAGSGAEESAAPLDHPENALAISNLVASSADLDFDEIDQVVDMFVHGETVPVFVRGLRLGPEKLSPYLVIAFDPTIKA